MIYSSFIYRGWLCLQLFCLEFLPNLKRKHSFEFFILEKRMSLLGLGGQENAELIAEAGFLLPWVKCRLVHIVEQVLISNSFSLIYIELLISSYS